MEREPHLNPVEDNEHSAEQEPDEAPTEIIEGQAAEQQAMKEELVEYALTELESNPELVEELVAEINTVDAERDTPLTDDEKAHLRNEFESVQAINHSELELPEGELAELDAKAAKEGEVTIWGSLWRSSMLGLTVDHVAAEFKDAKGIITGEDRSWKASARVIARTIVPPGMSAPVCEMMLRDPEARKQFLRMTVKDIQNVLTIVKYASPLAGPEAVPIAAGIDGVANAVGDKVLEVLDAEEDVNHQQLIKAIHEGSGMNDPEVRKKVMNVAAKKLQNKEAVQADGHSEENAGLLHKLGGVIQDNPELVEKIYSSWLAK